MNNKKNLGNNSVYDKEHDILYMPFGNSKVKHSIEIFNGNLVLDFDKDNNIVGFEIFDFMEEINKNSNFLAEISKIK